MTPFKNLVTPEQYANAQKHWTKLINGEISGGFDMELFLHSGAYENPHVCGTAGCSLGYVPETLGLNFKDFERASGYLNDDKASMLLGIDYDENENEWEWCFSSSWVDTDNTTKGAGIRMRILFEDGLPINWGAQMNGDHHLMYAHEL